MKLAFSKGLNYLYIGTENFRSAVFDLFSTRLAWVYIGAGIILNIAAWLLASAMSKSIGDELAVLHYNVTFGIDRIGNASSLFIMPLCGFALLVLNLLLVIFLKQKQERLLNHILLAMIVLGNGIILLGLYSSYIVNFS